MKVKIIPCAIRKTRNQWKLEIAKNKDISKSLTTDEKDNLLIIETENKSE